MFSRFTLYFDEVVRSGSIRRASERLNISPSAIDRHVLLMEEKLSVELFERLPQGLRLTAAGEVLIGNVRHGITLLKALVRMGAGVGMLTPADISDEMATGELVFVPLSEQNVPLSVLSLITAGGRTLSVPASLLLQHLSEAMRATSGSGIG